jgi:hypothetical protein
MVVERLGRRRRVTTCPSTAITTAIVATIVVAMPNLDEEDDRVELHGSEDA